MLESEPKVAGLDAGATQAHKLRETLDSKTTTGAELDNASKKAYAPADKLRGMSTHAPSEGTDIGPAPTVDPAQLNRMVDEADELGVRLAVATEAKLMAEILDLEQQI